MTSEQFKIIANVLNGIGLFFVALSMAFKKKNANIICQSANQVFSGSCYLLSYIALKNQTLSTFMICCVTLVMNFFILYNIQNKIWSIIFASLTFLLGMAGVVIGTTEPSFALKERSVQITSVIMASLPIFGTTLYNVTALSKKIPIIFMRSAFAISCVLWAVFSFYNDLPVAGWFNLVSVVINVIGTIIMWPSLKKEFKTNKNIESDANLSS